MLTFASGGWAILGAALLTIAILLWAVSGVVLRRGGAPRGDRVNVGSYGFDLSTCLIAKERLTTAGLRKDELRALVDPATIPASEATAGRGRKYLVPSDRVIGLEIAGERRAYPLLMLNGHEVVNDTLGGVPVAVTYSPLCDAAAVFDRRVEGETLEFGVSGLLYNANLLMFDRRPGAVGESLWSQLLGRAIAGPAARDGRQLRQIPAALLSWADWREAHPHTTVIARDPRAARLYEQIRGPYERYFAQGRLKPQHPVDPPPPADGPPPMERVVAVAVGAHRALFTRSGIARRAGASGRWVTEVAGTPLRFVVRHDPPTILVERADTAEPALATYCFWFAWHAMHPDDAPR
jgi:hypothetical protein